MTALFSLIALLLGSLALLLGLVMIAPQVRVHQIRVYSPGSWVFRVGIALTLAGILLTFTGIDLGDAGKLGWINGITALLGGVFVWNHEVAQSKHERHDRWDWQRSLTVQMIGSGIVLLVLGIVALPHP